MMLTRMVGPLVARKALCCNVSQGAVAGRVTENAPALEPKEGA